MFCSITFLMCLVGLVLGSTNHFVGLYYNSGYGITEYFPYPVGVCVSSGSAYVEYTCETSSKIIENTYSDPSCTFLKNTTNYTSSTTAGSFQSWSCSGSNYYVKASVYTANCLTLFVTSYYATDVCFENYGGNSYARATCYNTTGNATIASYAKTDSTCSGTMNASATLYAHTGCSPFTTILGIPLYSMVDVCQSGDVLVTSSVAASHPVLSLMMALFAASCVLSRLM